MRHAPLPRAHAALVAALTPPGRYADEILRARPAALLRDLTQSSRPSTCGTALMPGRCPMRIAAAVTTAAMLAVAPSPLAHAREGTGREVVAITIRGPRPWPVCAPSVVLDRDSARIRLLPGPARDLPGYAYIDAGGCAIVVLPGQTLPGIDGLTWASQAAREAVSSHHVSAETASRLARAAVGPGARGPVPAPADRSTARRAAAVTAHVVLLPGPEVGARPIATPHMVEQCFWYVEATPITGEPEPEEVCIDTVLWY